MASFPDFSNLKAFLIKKFHCSFKVLMRQSQGRGKPKSALLILRLKELKYGLRGEILEEAGVMCGKDFEDREHPEPGEVEGKLEKLERTRENLKNYIGEKEVFPFKEGEAIIYPGTEVRTRILRKYKDLLDNERVLTELSEIHIKKRIDDPKVKEWRRFVRKWGMENLSNILRSPDLILYDRKREAILYVKKVLYANVWRMAGVVVGYQNRYYIFTVKPMSGVLGDRYLVIYDKEKHGAL